MRTALLGMTLALPGAAPPQEQAPDFDEVRAALERACFECHGAADPEGALDLSAFRSRQSALARPDVWTYVRERLVDGDMPPPGHVRFAPSELKRVVRWIDGAFGAEDDTGPLGTGPLDTGPVDPGHAPIRRLNHTEYANTVRDLFGVEFDALAAFGRESVGHGYDTVGEALALPELLFEKYVLAAEEIAGRAFVTRDRTRRRFDSGLLEGGGDRELAGESARILSSRGEVVARFEAPRAGRYVVRARVGAHQAGGELARAVLRVGDADVLEREVEGYLVPQTVEHEAELAAGPVRLAVAFRNDYYDPDHPERRQRDRNLLVEWIEAEGPLDPPPRTTFQRELLARFPWSLGAARRGRILAHLCERVWRAPAGAADVERLLTLGAELSLEDHLRLALTAMLASPRFLLRVEEGLAGEDPAAPRALAGHELAVRLAYFLWSSTPDEALLARAREGGLASDAGLAAEVERLLEDPRARALATGFCAQWLELGALDDLTLDPQRYPGAARLVPAMREETARFFESILREGRPVWDLLEADYTFVNLPLATHYGFELDELVPEAGVPEPRGEGEAQGRAVHVRRRPRPGGFRRVSLAGLPRRGVLTQASVLVATSNPTRTSPVKRGRWVLGTLLGAPPPDPPPGAGALDESAEAARGASLRERLEAHRANPDCAVCHRTMDELGFGLENFDASGAWRTSADGFPVDASGVLPDGRRFDGPLELIATLRADGAFLATFTEELLVYALGRGLTRADRPLVASILGRLDPERASVRDVIHGIVRSAAFRTRRAQ